MIMKLDIAVIPSKSFVQLLIGHLGLIEIIHQVMVTLKIMIYSLMKTQEKFAKTQLQLKPELLMTKPLLIKPEMFSSHTLYQEDLFVWILIKILEDVKIMKFVSVVLKP